MKLFMMLRAAGDWVGQTLSDIDISDRMSAY